MCIKASKFLIVSVQFIFSFLLIGLPWLVMYGLAMAYIALALGLPLAYAVFYLIFNNENIKIMDRGMGGSANKTYRIRSQEFVSRQNIDLDRSQERTFFDRFIGQYRIYNIHGKGFKINRHFFFKSDLKIIKNKLHVILGLKYE